MTASDTPATTDPLDAEPRGATAIAAYARALRADIESGNASTLTLLLRASRLARGANTGRMERWLDCELRGYGADGDDTDELMELSRRWKDASARIGYMEPLPAIESRIAMLTERMERLDEEAKPPPLPTDADARLVAVQVALAKRMASRAERMHRKLVAQLGDLEAIRSSVLALLHGFVDRMCVMQPEAEAAPDSPTDGLAEEADSTPAAPEPDGDGDVDDDDGFEVGIAEDDESLPEAMLTDDSALDELIDSLGDTTPETLDTVVDDWDRIIDDDGIEETGMSPEELAEFLDDVLGPPGAEESTDEEPSGAGAVAAEAAHADEPKPHPMQEAAQSMEDLAPVRAEQDSNESEPDAVAELVYAIEALRDQMDDADAQEAVDAAGACTVVLGQLAAALGDEPAQGDAQAGLTAVIDARASRGEAASGLKARLNAVFDGLIEVEIGGDAERMKQICDDALALVHEVTNR